MKQMKQMVLKFMQWRNLLQCQALRTSNKTQKVSKKFHIYQIICQFN